MRQEVYGALCALREAAKQFNLLGEHAHARVCLRCAEALEGMDKPESSVKLSSYQCWREGIDKFD